MTNSATHSVTGAAAGCHDGDMRWKTMAQGASLTTRPMTDSRVDEVAGVAQRPRRSNPGRWSISWNSCRGACRTTEPPKHHARQGRHGRTPIAPTSKINGVSWHGVLIQIVEPFMAQAAWGLLPPMGRGARGPRVRIKRCIRRAALAIEQRSRSNFIIS